MTKPLKVSKGPKGNWRRQNLGWVQKGESRRPGDFLLGKDHAEACKRAVLLEKMWDAIVAHWVPSEQLSEPVWTPETYSVAKAVARGETEIVLDIPSEIATAADHLSAEDQRAYIGMWVESVRQVFPFLRLKLADDELAHQAEVGSTSLAEGLEEEAGKLLNTARQIKGLASGEQLHQALDAYSQHIREKYATKGRYLLTQIALLRQHSEDMPLSALDADKIETWLAYWCRRPKSFDSGKPLAFTTCRNVLIVLRRFVRWLNRTPQFKWQLPSAFSFPRCRIERLPEDLVKKRKYYKRSELTTIWQYAKPWDRALILLALNCGFSKREIATLQSGEIVEKKGHTYIKRFRTKTVVYGEWILWPETLQALAYLKQFHDGVSPYVVLNQARKPLTLGTAKGNENQIIKNHWDHIFQRIKEDHEGFFKLPFKHLRKTGATYLRHLHIKNAAELASMYLSHGEKEDSADQLLPAYTTRPWKKLHKALMRLREKLLPVLQSVENPWEAQIQRVSPKTVDTILTLRQQGKTHKEIAEQVGLHEVTVGKYCRRAASKLVGNKEA